MLRVLQILVSPIALVVGVVCLSACGQRGALYLPDSPASAQRATLPQTLTPALPLAPAAAASSSSSLPVPSSP
ncbi:MAG: lipoprotein [Burkholderiaceae bacterium]|nr:lipoprotein [Burkholderiaceae bacterium]